MSTDKNEPGSPPDFGVDDDMTKNDDSLFVSVMSPTINEISLSGGDDDDDEDPFGQPAPREKTATNTTTTVESLIDTEKNLFEPEQSQINLDDDEDIFGGKPASNNVPPLAAPVLAPITIPVAQPPTPVKQESPLFPVDSNINSPPPVRQASTFDSQISSSTPVSKSVLNSTATTSHPVHKHTHGDDIEITISDPTKVGDGMSSYMTYRITTKTTLPIFKKSEFTVNRRFSDFLGLHTKLVHKHLHTGIFIPSPPEKDSISMAKVKISKDEALPTDFIDRRRALLERYLNRLIQRAKLLEDSDVKEFLELASDLPKSTSTQAVSGAGVLRALTNISHQVTKLTAKTSEQDQWFEEKHTFVVDLHTHLKHLYNQFNTVFSHRKEACHALKHFSTALNHLATTEEHTLLSSALIELANLEEKIDQVNNEEALKEYSTLTELIKEYISLLDMVQLAFHERIKIHQQWLNAEETLKKKREAKTKLEQSPKGADKLPQAEMEINEWDGRVVRGKEEFEAISSTIKQEMDSFEETRIVDFKTAFDAYLQNVLEQEERKLQIWEAYLPEANKISV